MKRPMYSYKICKKIIRKMCFTNQKYWLQYKYSDLRDPMIPKNPHQVYKNEWEGWQEFMGSQYGVRDPRCVDLNLEKKIIKMIGEGMTTYQIQIEAGVGCGVVYRIRKLLNKEVK